MDDLWFLKEKKWEPFPISFRSGSSRHDWTVLFLHYHFLTKRNGKQEPHGRPGCSQHDWPDLFSLDHFLTKRNGKRETHGRHGCSSPIYLYVPYPSFNKKLCMWKLIGTDRQDVNFYISSSLGRAKNSCYQHYLVYSKIMIVWFHKRSTIFLLHQSKSLDKSFPMVSWLTFGFKNWPQTS